MSENRELTISEKALKLKISVMIAKKKPLLAKTRALECVLDDAIELMNDMANKLELLSA